MSPELLASVSGSRVSNEILVSRAKSCPLPWCLDLHRLKMTAKNEAMSGLVPRGRQWQSPKTEREDFPGGPVVKNPPANAGDRGSSLGRSPMLWGN